MGNRVIMDKNRVVTFGSLGGQEVPSDITNCIGNGFSFKGLNLTTYTVDSTNRIPSDMLKAIYYGFASVGVGDSNKGVVTYLPMFHFNNYTYGYGRYAPSVYLGDTSADALAKWIVEVFDADDSYAFYVFRCSLSNISVYSLRPTEESFTVEFFDKNNQQWTEDFNSIIPNS